MKLYDKLKELEPKDITHDVISSIVKEYPIFIPFSKASGFNKFLLYFVRMFSFGSTFMDTKTYNSSLENCEASLGFDFEGFKMQVGTDFDSLYEKLITWYLRSQKNRDFELLMKGTILYNQMLSEATSMTMFRKKKDEEDRVDYESKFSIFKNAMELNGSLALLEEKLQDSINLVGEVGKDIPGAKKPFVIRVEEL